MGKDFFNKINYSASNEDERSELRAFDGLLRPRTVCISASGSRPLALLLTDPEKIVSIDFNPTQNHLLELKIAAIRQFTHTEFLRFLGVRDADKNQRLQSYRESLRALLSDSARQFWDGHPERIRDGVIYCGTWERNQRSLALPLRKFRFPIDEIFEASTLEEQRQIWRERWDGPLWRSLVRISSWRWLWKYVYREPGINFVPRDFKIHHYMADRLGHALNNLHLRKSPFFQLLWTGRYRDCLPVHLAAENYDVIRSRVERIRIVTDSLTGYLSRTDEEFDAFSLSDFSSYSTRQQSDETWLAVNQRAAPGARVLAREFLVRHPLPQALSVRFSRFSELEHDLRETDDSCIYSFVCAEVSVR